MGVRQFPDITVLRYHNFKYPGEFAPRAENECIAFIHIVDEGCTKLRNSCDDSFEMWQVPAEGAAKDDIIVEVDKKNLKLRGIVNVKGREHHFHAALKDEVREVIAKLNETAGVLDIKVWYKLDDVHAVELE